MEVQLQDPPLKEMNIKFQTVDEIIEQLGRGSKTMLTKEQAALIVYTHKIDSLLASDEELKLLEAYNPELLGTYRALLTLAEVDVVESSIQDDDDIWSVGFDHNSTY